MLNHAKWLKGYVTGTLPQKSAGLDSDDEESEDDVDEDALTDAQLKVCRNGWTHGRLASTRALSGVAVAPLSPAIHWEAQCAAVRVPAHN
jgi:hypothetical protein